ncbi:DinB family protein [Planctomicrobium sp. SH661]|uniref:DinB family protein n=1 Tax=Planctomicrobium sp. SH661 TaxID=3448124 RepID=UPI003F5B8364
MFESEVHVNKFLLNYAQGLMADIPEERMAEQPSAGINHPAWILGHLIYTADSANALLGGKKTLPTDWVRRYGPGSELSTRREDYPSKEELLEKLKSLFETAHAQSASVDPAAMQAPNPRQQMLPFLPTVGDLVAFILAGHMGIHLGQLSSWRRQIGIGRLF